MTKSNFWAVLLATVMFCISAVPAAGVAEGKTQLETEHFTSLGNAGTSYEALELSFALRKETEHFTFWCADADVSMVDSFADLLESNYAYVTGWFQKEPTQKVKVEIEQGYGGSAGDYKLNACYDPVYGLGYGCAEVIIHEFTHIVMHEFSSDYLELIDGVYTFIPDFPKIFKEGVAAYVSGQDSASQDIPADVAAGTLRTLQQLWAVDQWTSDQWVYSYGYAYVKFLEEMYGHKQLLKIVENAGKPLPVLGMDESTLNNEWMAFLTQTYGDNMSTSTTKPTAAPTPVVTTKPTATAQPTATAASTVTIKPTASVQPTTSTGLKLQKETPHFVLWSVDAEAAAAIADVLEANYQRVTKNLRIEPKQKIQVEIDYGSPGGHAYTDRITITYDHVQGVNEYVKQIAVHEFVHMVANAHDPNSGQSTYLPAILYEGLATYEAAQDSASADIPEDLADGLYRSIPELEKLTTSNSNNTLYSYGYAYVKFLVETYGYDSMVKILKGQPRKTAIGEEDDVVNIKWLEFLERTYGSGDTTASSSASPSISAKPTASANPSASVRPSTSAKPSSGSATSPVPSATTGTSASPGPSAAVSATTMPSSPAKPDPSTVPTAKPAPDIVAVKGYQAGYANNRPYYVKASGATAKYYLRSSNGKMTRVAAPGVKAGSQSYYPVLSGSSVLFPRVENGKVTCYSEFQGGMEIPRLAVQAEVVPAITGGYQTGTVNGRTYYVKVSGASMKYYLKSSSGKMTRVAAPGVTSADKTRYYPINYGGTVLFPKLVDGRVTAYTTGSGETVLAAL